MKHQDVANAIALACAIAGFCVPAHAVNINPQGRGQVLLYPYYTVNSGQDTSLSVSNPTVYAQVAHVRFLEGRAGRPALDLDVHLTAYDAWSATISQVSDAGGARLTTADASCTRPVIPATGLAFTASGYDGSGALAADSGPHDLTRTREGFVEVIESAAVEFAEGGTVLTPFPFEIPPIDCATIFSSIVGHIGVIGGGLTGSAAIIKVADGIYYPYLPTVIDNFTTIPLYTETMSLLQPSLQQANSDTGAGGHLVANVFGENASFGTLVTPNALEFDTGIDAVSAVLMADSLQNDYLIEPGLGASTDWVLTFPTRRFYQDPIYPGYNEGANSGVGLFERSDAAFYDTEGNRLTVDEETIRPPYSTNVISFLRGTAAGARSGVFGSSLTRNYAPPANAGTMRLDVERHRTGPGGTSGQGLHSLQVSGFGAGLYGFPVVGFMAYNIVNANAAPGKLANYSGTFAHRTTACFGQTYLDPAICFR